MKVLCWGGHSSTACMIVLHGRPASLPLLQQPASTATAQSFANDVAPGQEAAEAMVNV